MMPPRIMPAASPPITAPALPRRERTISIVAAGADFNCAAPAATGAAVAGTAAASETAKAIVIVNLVERGVRMALPSL
jgi:hypothetical protein